MEAGERYPSNVPLAHSPQPPHTGLLVDHPATTHLSVTSTVSCRTLHPHRIELQSQVNIDIFDIPPNVAMLVLYFFGLLCILKAYDDYQYYKTKQAVNCAYFTGIVVTLLMCLDSFTPLKALVLLMTICALAFGWVRDLYTGNQAFKAETARRNAHVQAAEEENTQVKAGVQKRTTERDYWSTKYRDLEHAHRRCVTFHQYETMNNLYESEEIEIKRLRNSDAIQSTSKRYEDGLVTKDSEIEKSKKDLAFEHLKTERYKEDYHKIHTLEKELETLKKEHTEPLRNNQWVDSKAQEKNLAFDQFVKLMLKTVNAGGDNAKTACRVVYSLLDDYKAQDLFGTPGELKGGFHGTPGNSGIFADSSGNLEFLAEVNGDIYTCKVPRVYNFSTMVQFGQGHLKEKPLPDGSRTYLALIDDDFPENGVPTPQSVLQPVLQPPSDAPALSTSLDPNVVGGLLDIKSITIYNSGADTLFRIQITGPTAGTSVNQLPQDAAHTTQQNPTVTKPSAGTSSDWTGQPAGQTYNTPSATSGFSFWGNGSNNQNASLDTNGAPAASLGSSAQEATDNFFKSVRNKDQKSATVAPSATGDQGISILGGGAKEQQVTPTNSSLGSAGGNLWNVLAGVAAANGTSLFSNAAVTTSATGGLFSGAGSSSKTAAAPPNNGLFGAAGSSSTTPAAAPADSTDDKEMDAWLDSMGRSQR
ncbi:hypothetical protein BU23DRAFT_599092 [Bimuria novae-zelandiae CBS 107.79]|uniref:Uncharacterized protein n=1 Tax=Bimuria novae-zelandiae CBS 107.79 TaxID=1447943 RepID=A0A6A5V8F8_9PLEO|nr:hypothetical protein BU23DRAFT_599092 [Bimuria novae-zelandiae CBS 107.79]